MRKLFLLLVLCFFVVASISSFVSFVPAAYAQEEDEEDEEPMQAKPNPMEQTTKGSSSKTFGVKAMRGSQAGWDPFDSVADDGEHGDANVALEEGAEMEGQMTKGAMKGTSRMKGSASGQKVSTQAKQAGNMKGGAAKMKGSTGKMNMKGKTANMQ
ncbi:hypothetical protein ACFL96_16710 [Thermoproteota archaeon]